MKNTKLNIPRPYPHFKFPEEITMEIELLNDDHSIYYGGKTGLVKLRCSNYGWFPVKELMGVTNGRYDPNHPKSLKYGASQSPFGGTATILISKEKLSFTINHLKKIGYTFK